MTAKILSVSLLFLLILYVFSAVDFALAGSLILAAILFRIAAAWLFSAAFLSFVFFLIARIFGLHFDFIADLSVTSYAFFASGLGLFFIRGEKQSLPLAMPQADFFKFAGIILLVVLLYPLTGTIVSAVLVYGGFLLAFPRFRDGRWPFITAILFLLGCPIFLITRQDDIAVQSAILAYSFLIIGVFQILTSSIGQKKLSKELVHPL